MSFIAAALPKAAIREATPKKTMWCWIVASRGGHGETAFQPLQSLVWIARCLLQDGL